MPWTGRSGLLLGVGLWPRVGDVARIAVAVELSLWKSIVTMEIDELSIESLASLVARLAAQINALALEL